MYYNLIMKSNIKSVIIGKPPMVTAMQPWRAKPRQSVFIMPRKNTIDFELKTKFNEESKPIFKTYNTFHNYLLQRTIL